MRLPVSIVVCCLLGACAAAQPPGAPTLSVRDELVRQGFQPTLVNGEMHYCRSEMVTGSQFTGRVCRTEAQLRELEDRARATSDSRAMHPGFSCHNPQCSP